MKIAIPIYNSNISNVFDFAHRLLLVEIENNKEVNRSEIPLEAVATVAGAEVSEVAVLAEVEALVGPEPDTACLHGEVA